MLTDATVLFQIAGIGIIVALIQTILKQMGKEEIAQFATLLGFIDRKSTRLNSSHVSISYAVFCLKKKNNHIISHEHHASPLTDQITVYNELALVYGLAG